MIERRHPRNKNCRARACRQWPAREIHAQATG
jgi:hypothetical protein